jgi:hypothetical protein
MKLVTNAKDYAHVSRLDNSSVLSELTTNLAVPNLRSSVTEVLKRMRMETKRSMELVNARLREMRRHSYPGCQTSRLE